MTALKACTIRSTRGGQAVQTRVRVRSVRAELSGIYENDPGYRDATQFSGIYIPGKSGMVGRYAYRSDSKPFIPSGANVQCGKSWTICCMMLTISDLQDLNSQQYVEQILPRDY